MKLLVLNINNEKIVYWLKNTVCDEFLKLSKYFAVQNFNGSRLFTENFMSELCTAYIFSHMLDNIYHLFKG